MRRIATGLGAIAVLVLLVVGFPILLWMIGPIGLPHIEPTPAGLWQALLRPDDGTLFLTLIKIAGWVVWALLTFSVLAEGISRLGHLRVPHLPGLALPQGLARGLVAAAVTLFINTNSALSTPVPASAEPPVAAAPALAGQPLKAQTTEARSALSFDHYTVKKGDILSQLALDHLGDAHRYPEIYKASRDIRQPGGARLADPDVIDIGWKLNIPNGHGRDEGKPQQAKPEKPAVAQPRTVSPEPAPVVPEGSTSAADPVSSAQPVATASIESEDDQAEVGYQPGWLLTGLSGAGALLAGSLWLILLRRRAVQHHHRRLGFTTAAPPRATAPVEKTLRHQGRPIADLVTFVEETLRRFAATILEGADRLPSLTAVEVARSSLTLHLADAPKLPVPWRQEADRTSWTITTADDPDSIGPLEPDGPAPWPHLTTVGADDTGHWWLLNLEQLGTLTITGDNDYAHDLARYIAAELATNPWSRDLEIDLTGVFDEIVGLDPSRCHHHTSRAGIGDSLTAAVDMVDRVNRAGAVDIPTARVRQHDDELWPSRILVARHDPTGQLDQLTELINTMPLRTATVALIISPAGDHLGGPELVATAEGRVQVVSLGLDLVGNGITADEARGCVQLLQAADDLTPAAVPPAEPVEGEPWRAFSDAAGRLREEFTEPRDPSGQDEAGDSNVPEPDQTVTATAATTPADLAILAPAIPESTRSKGEEVDPTLNADLEAWFAPSGQRPRLAVLGAMKVRVAPGRENEDTARRRPYYTELVAYLATRPRGATTDEICRAFDTNAGRVRRDLATVRKWLGTDPTSGASYLPGATQQAAADGKTTGRYELSGLLCDAHLFRRLRVRGQSRGPAGIDDFGKALSLVGGPPYDDIRDRGGIWLTDNRDDQNLLVAIVDTAHLVATMAMQTGDYETARRAAETAMKAAPDEEVPKLDLAAAAAAQGKLGESAQVVRGVIKQRDTDGPLNLDRRTTDLLQAHGWTAPRARTG